jgi:hypothetical protein
MLHDNRIISIVKTEPIHACLMRLVITKHNRPARQTWSILYRLALLQLSMTIATLGITYALRRPESVYCQRK